MTVLMRSLPCDGSTLTPGSSGEAVTGLFDMPAVKAASSANSASAVKSMSLVRDLVSVP